jgi:hypothetical protein
MSRQTVTLYHGTAHDFSAFDESSVGRGGEGNAALGVHLTEDSSDAAEYAQSGVGDEGAGQGRVLVVEVDLESVVVISSPEDFFGQVDDDMFLGADHFAAIRQRLLVDGREAVVGANGTTAGIWVVLDPTRIRIVGQMTVDEAYDAESASEYDGVEMSDKGAEMFDVERFVAPTP